MIVLIHAAARMIIYSVLYALKAMMLVTVVKKHSWIITEDSARYFNLCLMRADRLNKWVLSVFDSTTS